MRSLDAGPLEIDVLAENLVAQSPLAHCRHALLVPVIGGGRHLHAGTCCLDTETVDVNEVDQLLANSEENIVSAEFLLHSNHGNIVVLRVPHL